MKTQHEFIAIVKNLLSKNPEALDFIVQHNEFVHGADDLVDEEMEPKFKAGLLLKFLQYYQHPYYLRHATVGLAMLSLVNHMMYEISVKWEHSGDNEKRIAAGILRHNSITMLFAVIAIECGTNVANQWASELFEHTFLAHKDDKEFKPVCQS
jgi:hypothetical protein